MTTSYKLKDIQVMNDRAFAIKEGDNYKIFEDSGSGYSVKKATIGCSLGPEKLLKVFNDRFGEPTEGVLIGLPVTS